jgi:phosphoserine phosphatase RsbU/P
LKVSYTRQQIFRRLGFSGTAFLVALVLYLVFYFTRQTGLLLLDCCVLLPLGVVLAFRGLRLMQRTALWSLRNRLLFVYCLFGVLPVVLLLSFFLLTGWALMSELAIYLADSALDRRIASVQSAVETIRHESVSERLQSLPKIQNAYGMLFPGIRFCVRDTDGTHEVPIGTPAVTVPEGWGNTSGLLTYNRQFYAWAHYRDSSQEITILAPLSDASIENLVPHLGVIGLVEGPGPHEKNPISAGALSFTPNENPGARAGDFVFIENRGKPGAIPPPVNRFDIPVVLPSVHTHYHLDEPGQPHQAVLYVHSRVSAVLRAFFSDPDILRGFLADTLIGIAFLFLLVEVVAIVIGVSLSRRITRAVNQLYEGTRQVIRGDFSHRIPVKTRDQLGELGESFNQMTGNLERLLLVEKERERLHAELEIAREVQRQLYPSDAPSIGGLKLTARCDPARMVSGDYYDYQAVGNTKLAFAIGDVAGKGISAALLMATIQAALRAQVSHALPISPSDCGPLPQINSAVLVSQLNQQVYAHSAPEKYATFFFGLYDDVTSTLTYTNAGHLSPLLFRNGDVVPLDSNGTVVGAFSFAKYDESCVLIEHGDLLVCYTDGITEPENAYGEMFGEARLVQLVQKHIHAEEHELIRIIFDAVRSWTASPELQDDMTLLMARQVGAPS